MIVKVVNAVRASLCWMKADSAMMKGLDDDAMLYLDKGARIISKETMTYLLSKGLLFYRKKDYQSAVITMKSALDKIEENNYLKDDDRVYLIAFAKDIINFSIVHGDMDMKLLPVSLTFNINNIKTAYRNRYTVITDRKAEGATS